jgi:hemolysin activation/secretion protein
VRDIQVSGAEGRALAWVRGRLAQFQGRCVGPKGLDYILKSLERDFLARGLITTRAGLPQQDLGSGVLKVQVVPGRVAGVDGGSRRARRAWAFAAPLHKGDLAELPALSQGVEQMQRVPGRQVSADLEPGERPGDSLVDLKVKPPFLPISGQVSANNLAGRSVANWQGSLALAGADLLGVSDLWTANLNSNLARPDLPADSRGDSFGLSLPYGWWTFAATAQQSTYRQTIVGEVADFVSSGDTKSVEASLQRVVHRDAASRTSLELKVRRRWERYYIDGVEIGLQRRDLTDLTVGLLERRNFGRAQLDLEFAWRQGVPWFDAQQDPSPLPAGLPTARYTLFTLDASFVAPLAGSAVLDAYRAQGRAQNSGSVLFGSDTFSVGGPFTVRGFESERAVAGYGGWYLRQELSFKSPLRQLQPYALVDAGQIAHADAFLAGAGAGLRANWRGFTLDAFAAMPLTAPQAVYLRKPEIGVTAGWGWP